jgi:hypothetical protein
MSRLRSVGIPCITFVIGLAAGMILSIAPSNTEGVREFSGLWIDTARADEPPVAPQTNPPPNLLADSKPKSDEVVSSRKIQIGFDEYELQFKNGKLQLQTRGLEREDRNGSSNLQFKLPEGGTISELLMTKWMGRLAAVVEVTRADEREYYCLFIALRRPSDSGKPTNVPRALSMWPPHKFLTTKENLRILAANGEWGGDNFLAVLGKIQRGCQADDGSLIETRVTSGAFYIDYCPMPPAGQTQPFNFKVVKGTSK